VSADLTVKLGLDGKQYADGLKSATSQSKAFSDTFKRSLNETRGAVKDVSGSIEGIGKAFDGSVSGAVAGFRDLLQLVALNPWAAWGAAGAAAITAVAKAYENFQDKIMKGEDAIGTTRAKFRDAVLKASGIKTQEQTLKEGDDNKLAAGIANRTLEMFNLTDQIEKANAQLSKMRETPLEFSTEIPQVQKTIQAMEQMRGELAVQINDLTAEDDKRADKREKSGRDFFDNETKRLEDEAKERRKLEDDDTKASDKKSKLQRDASRDRADAIADENKAAKEIGAKDFSSIFDKGDVYQRMGGQVGRNIDPALRQRDIADQRAKEMTSLQEKTNETLNKINDKLQAAIEGE